MHIIPFNIGDFSQATERFKPVHLGIFLRLLMEYYKSEKALTDDATEIEWIAGVETKSERDALMLVLRRCFVHDAARKVWVQKRVERELEQYELNGLQKRHANVCKYWEKTNSGLPCPTLEQFLLDPSFYYDETTRRVRTLSARTPHGLRTDESRSPETPLSDSYTETSNQKPVTSNQNSTPIVPKGTDSSPPFGSDLDSDRPPPPTGQSETEKKKKGSRPNLVWTEETKAIYLAYPRKIAPDAALRAIQKRLAQGIPAATLLAAVTAYATATAGTEREFIPHPATWFNKGRFADDPAEWKHEPDVPQKKEKASRILPEPDFDWRARARDLGMNPPDDLQWSQTTPDFRREITAA